MFAVTTFGLSFAALVAMFVFKDWELRRKVRVFPDVRERLTSFVETKVLPVREKLPEVGRQSALFLASEAKSRLLAFSLQCLHLAENLLLRAFLFIRGKRTLLKENGSVSPFLRDIAEHKESLAEERKTIQ